MRQNGNASKTDSIGEYYVKKRAELDKGALAQEMIAEQYGEFLNATWDAFNQSEKPLDVFRRLDIPALTFGEWTPPRALEHRIQHSIMRREKQVHWQNQQWVSWMDTLASSGIHPEQMQWRHVGFELSKQNEPVSTVQFEFHTRRNDPVKRWILRGFLKVYWIPMTGVSSYPSIRRMEVTEAELLEREGLPPFDHVVASDISPADHDIVLEPNLQSIDLNADGLPELIVSRINRVFWNQGSGKFRTGNLMEFTMNHFHQGVFADFNGDSFLDFLAVSTEGLRLYAGDGKGAYSKGFQTQHLFKGQLENPFVLTAGDIDGDGDLDAWLGQYKVPYQNGQMPTPFFDANDGYPAFLLMNDGSGKFTDITSGSGLEPKRFRRTYSGSLVDVDQDQDLDLLVVSDFAGADLYLNQGDGTFEDVTDSWLGERQGFGMAHVFGDWNVDGRLDFLMIGMHSPTVERMQSLGIQVSDDPLELPMKGAMAFGNRLYFGDTNGFNQKTGIHPLQRSGWSWGTVNIDFDLDGDEDVYIVNGHISGARTHDYEPEFWREDLFIGNSKDNSELNTYFESKQLRFRQSGASYGGYERNRFFLNMEDREWMEVGYLFGLSMSEDCRNVVAGDLDGNGLPDLAVTTFELWPDEKQTLHLFPNFYTSQNQWIGIDLRPTVEQAPLMGTVLRIKTNQRSYMRPIVSGDGYRSQSPYQVVIGLKGTETVEQISLQWPNGSVAFMNPFETGIMNVWAP